MKKNIKNNNDEYYKQIVLKAVEEYINLYGEFFISESEKTIDRFELALSSYIEYDKFKIETGISKIVVLFEDYSNYVFKIPFNYGKEWNKFSCVNSNKKFYWNYCYSEQIIYEKAKEVGVEKFFVPLENINEEDSYPIYRQERIKTIEEFEDDIHFFYNDKYFMNDSSVLFINNYWVSKIPSEKEKKLLLEFLTENEIEDLEEYNIGFTKDFFPVIIDYAG